MNNDIIIKRIALIGVGTLLIGLVIFAIYIGTTRIGKVSVELHTLPSDAKVEIDGNTYTSGTIYLSPGEKTYKASRQGFEDKESAVQIVERGSPSNSIFISLAPNSDEGDTWLDNHAEEIQKFESLSGASAVAAGEELRDKYPVVSLLPIQSPLYTIGYKNVDSGGIVITVRAPEQYRQAALVYLASQDVRLSDYNFMFYDEENPFK